MSKKMPERLVLGNYMQATLAHTLTNKKMSEEAPDFHNPQGLPTLMGFVIPTWQRPLVWTKDQKVKFIESAWYGINLGTYTYQQYHYTGKAPSKFNGYLIDGQQRMSALDDYFGDRLEVFGAKWSEVDEVDQRGFQMSRTFSCYISSFQTEEEMIEMYERLSFGGTPHTEADRPKRKGSGGFKNAPR